MSKVFEELGLEPPFEYVPGCQLIFDANGTLVLEIRGFGFFKDMIKQDKFANEVVRLLNKDDEK
jgi:hypothetical protein